MERIARDALLQRLREQAALCGAPRTVRARRLPFRLVLPRILDAAGLTWCVTAETFFGRRMRVHLPELVGVKLYQYGFFEEGLTQTIIEQLPPGGVFIDIGAHVGLLLSPGVAAGGIQRTGGRFRTDAADTRRTFPKHGRSGQCAYRSVCRLE